MYRRPKFLEVLLAIREEMARESDYDVDFFAEMVRNGIRPATDVRHSLIDEAQNGESIVSNGSAIAKTSLHKARPVKSK